MREKLNSELKKSIINKDLAATKTIRLIIAAIKDRDIVVRTEGNQNGISDADIISLLKKMQKQREESIQLYLKGNRIDLVQSEEDEIKIIKEFLPKQMDDEEIEALLDQTRKQIKKDSKINDGDHLNTRYGILPVPVLFLPHCWAFTYNTNQKRRAANDK